MKKCKITFFHFLWSIPRSIGEGLRALGSDVFPIFTVVGFVCIVVAPIFYFDPTFGIPSSYWWVFTLIGAVIGPLLVLYSLYLHIYCRSEEYKRQWEGLQ